MKTLVLNAAILLIVLSSCSTGKSFMHQRYTSLGHSKHHAATEQKSSYVTNKVTTPVAEPVAVQEVPAMIATPVSPAVQSNNEVLTANAGSNIITKRKPLAQLADNNFISKGIATVKHSDVSKASTKQVKHEKRGLLFGVIDALLSIILIVVVVAVVVFLIIVLI